MSAPRKCGLLLAAALLSGCLTVVPMQTASTVPKGAYRLGGQAAISPWCSATLNPSRYCDVTPQGVPLPELRGGARHGLGDDLDLGASVQLAATAGRGFRAGMFVDAKKELWSRPLDAEGGRRQLLSIGPGVGFASEQVLSNPNAVGLAVIDAALPLYFGHQTRGFEWVASARVLERVTFADMNGDLRREPYFLTDVGLTGGLHGRGALRFSLELGYQASVGRWERGLFTVAVGFSGDVLPSGED